MSKWENAERNFLIIKYWMKHVHSENPREDFPSLALARVFGKQFSLCVFIGNVINLPAKRTMMSFAMNTKLILLTIKLARLWVWTCLADNNKIKKKTSLNLSRVLEVWSIKNKPRATHFVIWDYFYWFEFYVLNTQFQFNFQMTFHEVLKKLLKI